MKKKLLDRIIERNKQQLEAGLYPPAQDAWEWILLVQTTMRDAGGALRALPLTQEERVEAVAQFHYGMLDAASMLLSAIEHSERTLENLGYEDPAEEPPEDEMVTAWAEAGAVR